MSQEFTPIHTIEYWHVIAAIPGDTLRQKYDWVQAQLKPPTCDCGGGRCCDHSESSGSDNGADAAAKAMAKTLDEINEAIIKFMSTDEDAAKTLATIMGIVGRVE